MQHKVLLDKFPWCLYQVCGIIYWLPVCSLCIGRICMLLLFFRLVCRRYRQWAMIITPFQVFFFFFFFWWGMFIAVTRLLSSQRHKTVAATSRHQFRMGPRCCCRRGGMQGAAPVRHHTRSQNKYYHARQTCGNRYQADKWRCIRHAYRALNHYSIVFTLT